MISHILSEKSFKLSTSVSFNSTCLPAEKIPEPSNILELKHKGDQEGAFLYQ